MAVIGKTEYKYADYNGEVSSFGVPCAVITAANFDAQAVLRTSLEDALADILIGNLLSKRVMNEVVQGVTPPDDETAQRELSWAASYFDTVKYKRYTMRVPTPLLTALDPNNRAFAAIGDTGIVDAFVTAFEAYFVSQDNNPATVDRIKLVRGAR